jgi:4-aminobutyrate aminotransferase-like enzyme
MAPYPINYENQIWRTSEALFQAMRFDDPEIKEIRGKGLMLSIQLSSFEQVEYVSNYCSDKGIIIDWFLHCDTAMRIAPPLIISEEEIKIACTIVLEALDSYLP